MTTTLDEFEHYIHQTIAACSKKEEIGMLKNEIETLNEELIKSLTKKLNVVRAKQIWQTETRETPKHQSWQNVPLETGIIFVPLPNTQD